MNPEPGFLKGRHFLSVADWSDEEIQAVFALTDRIKAGETFDAARGKTLALLFEKPSLRTRVTFTVAMTRLGGETIYLSRDEVGLGQRESVADVARGLSRWVDASAVRTFAHQIVEELAENSRVPIVNALTDREHPCQALADFQTIREEFGDVRGRSLVFIGDGNNVAASLMLLAPRLGTHFTLACPPGYEPESSVWKQALQLSEQYGTQMILTDDAQSAAVSADVLYTDVWASMGQEEETAKRARDFAAFQVNADLLSAAKPDTIVLHCLPAHRGQEIAADVIDGPQSRVWNEAENRLHVQQALLLTVL